MSQSTKIAELVTAVNNLSAAIATRFGTVEGQFANYLPLNATAASARTVTYEAPVDEHLVETPAATATFLGDKIHVVNVEITDSVVGGELTLVIPGAASLIDGWVTGGLNGLLTTYAYDVGENVGAGKVIVRKLDVQGRTYLQVGQTWGTPSWGSWQGTGGGGDADTLEGKTVNDIVAQAKAAADFSTAPLNAFLGVDYDAMVALGEGYWAGKADATNMHPATLNGIVDVHLEAVIVATTTGFQITRRIESTYASWIEHIEYITAETAGYTQGFGRVYTSRDDLKDLRYDADNTLQQLIEEITGDLTSFSTTLTDFIAAKATGAEVITGTDDVKYTTALAVRTAIIDAIDALVDGAPTALDTLNKLAAALGDQESELAAILLALDDKLGKTEQAADSLKLNGKTQAELTASNGETATGTATDKFVTPAGLKSVTDPIGTRIGTVETDIDELLDELTAAIVAGTTTVSS